MCCNSKIFFAESRKMLVNQYSSVASVATVSDADVASGVGDDRSDDVDSQAMEHYLHDEVVVQQFNAETDSSRIYVNSEIPLVAFTGADLVPFRLRIVLDVIQPTSVPAERLFASARDARHRNQERMLDSRFEMHMLLKCVNTKNQSKINEYLEMFRETNK